MEAHPIPQNVTAFQFKLIGDMTLKQFLYLAAGFFIAYICFVFLTPVVPIIAWPLLLVSSILGIAFAFLPISNRPLDHWVGAFFKAVYSPTKRTWRKNGRSYHEDPLFIKRLVLFTQALTVKEMPMPTPHRLPPTLITPQPIPAPKPPTFNPPPQPQPIPQNQPIMQQPRFTQNLPPTPPPAPRPVETPPSGPVLTPEELAKTVELARQAQFLQVQIVNTQRQLNEMKNATPIAIQNPEEYSKQINEILKNLQQLVSQATNIKEQLNTVTHAVPLPVQTEKAEVKVIEPAPAKPADVVLTSFPNVINGIVADAEGNYLNGVVVVVFDKEGLPVRALKTNKLGQFSGATPLPNGTYTIQLEKDNLVFDVLQVELEGKILTPLKIAAKKVAAN